MSSLATRVPSAEEGADWVHFTFPEAHRRQIRSTNPLECLNKELDEGDRRPASRGTCAGAQGRLEMLTSCPRSCGRRSSTASPTGKRGVVVQVETAAVALAVSWSRSRGSSSRSLVLATSISWIRPALRRAKAVPALWSADAALAVLRSLTPT